MRPRTAWIQLAFLGWIGNVSAEEWTGLRDAQLGMETRQLDGLVQVAKGPNATIFTRPSDQALASKLGLSQILYEGVDGKLAAIEMLTVSEAQTQAFAKAIVSAWGAPNDRSKNGRVTTWIGSTNQLILVLGEKGTATVRLEALSPAETSDLESWADELYSEDREQAKREAEAAQRAAEERAREQHDQDQAERTAAETLKAMCGTGPFQRWRSVKSGISLCLSAKGASVPDACCP